MNIQEIKKLNLIKQMIIPVCLLCVVIWCILYYLAGFTGLVSGKFYEPIMITSTVFLFLLIPMFYFFYFVSKIEKVFVSYVLSNFRDWKLTIKRQNRRRKENWYNEMLPPQDFVYYSVLPGYGALLHIVDGFSDNKKSIVQVQYIDLSKGMYRKATYLATLITVKTSKDLHNTTYFRTNNYPPQIDKNITIEREDRKLPDIKLSNAANNNIDVYGNNPDIAEKLGTQELFTVLQNIKEQLNLAYAEAIFHDDYIIFVLRHRRYNLLDYGTFFINISLFKRIDYILADQAINNFKLLTDLANQAEEFTKNI